MPVKPAGWFYYNEILLHKKQVEKFHQANEPQNIGSHVRKKWSNHVSELSVTLCLRSKHPSDDSDTSASTATIPPNRLYAKSVRDRKWACVSKRWLSYKLAYGRTISLYELRPNSPHKYCNTGSLSSNAVVDRVWMRVRHYAEPLNWVMQ